MTAVQNRCPACQAGFRRSLKCPRCGADLEPLMRLTLDAYLLREAARDRIREHDYDDALNLVEQAQQLQQTSEGRSLLQVLTVLI